MTSGGPRCTRDGCRHHVTQPRQVTKSYRPKRGWRVVDGVYWNWFCSRACAGVVSGRRNAESGLLELNLFPAARARYAVYNRRRQAHFDDEAKDLARFGVPREFAVAVLDRVFQLGVKHGRDTARRRLIPQAGTRKGVAA